MELMQIPVKGKSGDVKSRKVECRKRLAAVVVYMVAAACAVTVVNSVLIPPRMMVALIVRYHLGRGNGSRQPAGTGQSCSLAPN